MKGFRPSQVPPHSRAERGNAVWGAGAPQTTLEHLEGLSKRERGNQ